MASFEEINTDFNEETNLNYKEHSNIEILSDSNSTIPGARKASRALRIAIIVTVLFLSCSIIYTLIAKKEKTDSERPKDPLFKKFEKINDYKYFQGNHQTTNKAIESAIKLKDHNLTFRIIIIAWRRRASLERLIKSLLKVDYRGFTIHLDFNIDGDPHPNVLDYINGEDINGKWPHGSIRISRNSQRIGLETNIMNAWRPVNDLEFAFFFEDDVEVSPLFFDYSIVALDSMVLEYQSDTKNGVGLARREGKMADRMVGISLYTPRMNEVSIPKRVFNAEMVVGESEAAFALQLPCSWGALYFPWHWRQFITFYDWRTQPSIKQNLYKTVPSSETNDWPRSWKKYLVELMFMRGLWMLYPNLAAQKSFSTNYSEPGEHTLVQPSEASVNLVKVNQDYYITVPLLGGDGVDDNEKIAEENEWNRLIFFMINTPIFKLKIASFAHEVIQSEDGKEIDELRALGLSTLDLIKQEGWPADAFSCVLDYVRGHDEKSAIDYTPISKSSNKNEKYLIWEPRLSLGHQVNALQNAFAYAKILKRTLLISPFWSEQKNLPIENLLRLPASGSNGIFWEYLKDDLVEKGIFLDESGEPVKIRSALMIPYRQRNIFKSKLEESRPQNAMSTHSKATSTISLYTLYTKQSSIIDNFYGCTDKFLSFSHLFSSFRAMDDPLEDAKFKQWLEANLGFKPEITEATKTFKERLLVDDSRGKVTGCVYWGRGENPKRCGLDTSGEISKYNTNSELIKYRSCVAGLESTIGYLMDDARNLDISLSTIYIVMDEGVRSSSTKTLLSSLASTTYRDKQILTIDDLTKHISSSLSNTTKELAPEIASSLEIELCIDADLFLGNPFSSISHRIAESRQRNSFWLGYTRDYKNQQ